MAKEARKKAIEVAALKHQAAKRLNIPTAEFESMMREEDSQHATPMVTPHMLREISREMGRILEA